MVFNIVVAVAASVGAAGTVITTLFAFLFGHLVFCFFFVFLFFCKRERLSVRLDRKAEPYFCL